MGHYGWLGQLLLHVHPWLYFFGNSGVLPIIWKGNLEQTIFYFHFRCIEFWKKKLISVIFFAVGVDISRLQACFLVTIRKVTNVTPLCFEPYLHFLHTVLASIFVLFSFEKNCISGSRAWVWWQLQKVFEETIYILKLILLFTYFFSVSHFSMFLYLNL